LEKEERMVDAKNAREEAIAKLHSTLIASTHK
jgi:hypothetical protein